MGEGKAISLGKAAKKYGISKATLSRYADKGRVETVAMPGTRGQARMLDEVSVYKVVKERMEGKGGVKGSYTGEGKQLILNSGEVAREYLKHCENRGYSKTGRNDCERVVMGFCQRYDDLPLSGSEVQEYVHDMKVSPQTKKAYFGLIRTFYNWVEAVYDVPTPIRKGMAPKAKKQLPRALDGGELSRMMEMVEDRQDKVMINTFLATAIRRGELCNLDKEDVFPGHIHIKAVEGNKTGEGNVPIPEWLYKQLVSLGNGEGHVFAGADGERITRDCVSSRVIRLMKSAGIKGNRRGPHTLRHTAACNLLESTGDLDFVRQILRHTDMNMTLIYAQLRPRSVEEKYQSIMSDALNGGGDIKFMDV